MKRKEEEKSSPWEGARSEEGTEVTGRGRNGDGHSSQNCYL